MNTFSTVKKLTASSAMAGVLGLAALGLGSGLAAAAPSTHSGFGPTSSTSRTSARNSWDPGSPSTTGDEVVPQVHVAFPHATLSPHMNQGHKGWNEPKAPAGMHAPITADASPAGPNGKFAPKKHELFAVQRGDV